MIRKFSSNPYEGKIEGCNPGSEKAYNYSMLLDDKGDPYLKGEEYNIQEVINSYAEQCSIARIIQAHGLGDDLLMNQKPGVYLDEKAVKTIQLGASSPSEMNTQILSLYESYKDVMSLSEFAHAISTGDFEKLSKVKKTTTEEEAKE